MNNKEYIIIWQKWVDPFGDEELSDLINNIKSSDYDNEEDFENTEDVKHDDLLDKQLHPFHKKNIKVIATPMGIIPVTENTASGKIFNFWVGHSNFNITKKIVSIIEETDGVESLDIFTRYRFRISVGKAFNDSDVMRDINDKVYNHLG